jgi:hypothetical protein
MTAHALFAPSAMARIVQCPGSVMLAATYPETEGPEAAEGTAAHWVLSEAAQGRQHAAGTVAPNGVPVDDDMIDGADMALQVIQSWKLAMPRIEQPVRIPRVHREHCWGTPDAYTVWQERRRIAVLDFKFGHGFIDAFRNWQMVAYAAGVLDALALDTDAEALWIVDMTIVQPRNYHRDGPVRTWAATVPELRAMWQQMVEACALALQPDAPLRVGTECKHCPARHACATLQGFALDVCDTVGKAMPLELPTEAAARELLALQRAAKLLEARMSGLEAQVSDACRRGVPVPHFHLEPSVGRETWSVPPEQVKALGELMGVNVTKDALVTPAQARKAGLIVDGFTMRPNGAVKLVPDGNKAAKIFGKTS